MSLTFTTALRANKPKRNVQVISGCFAACSLAIQKNGRAWAWGINTAGQLGDNSIISRLTPVSVAGAVKTFCKISGGNGHSLAIDKNGRAWGWGLNSTGQVGDNSQISRFTPVSVGGAVKTFCQISAGSGGFSVAIDKNGRAWAWGNNGNGRLGDNSTISRFTPVSVAGAVKTFCQISGGGGFSVAIDKNGRAWAWGINNAGQLGDNSIISRFTPVSVAGAVKTFCQISGGGNHTIAIDRYGRAWGWGINTNGRIGDGTLVSKLTPVSIVGAVRTFCEISCGNSHSLAIDKNGRAWAWGLNTTSQLGDGTMSSQLTPVSVAGNITFCKISAGNTHSLAIDKNGRAWGWGLNSTGQLGDNAIIVSYTTPINVSGEVKTFCEISGGGNGSLAIDKNGLVWGWGINTGSQIGDGTGNNRKTPVSVAGTVKTFCKISAGFNHSAAIDKYGLVWCWGTNNQGQLGINSLTGVSTPVKILGQVKTFCQINAAANSNRVNAIDKNGLAWGWGVNNQGGIGDNSTTSRLTPVSVLGAVKTFCQISGGEASTVAIDKNGRAWAWGINNAGQLGDNSIISRLTPVSVAGAVKTFCQITGSANTHTVAIDKNGRAWCWGNNNNGQLGDNSTTSRLTPVSVLGAVKTFCQISAGYTHTLAIDKYGRAWGWGSNSQGQLGDGSNTQRLTPVSVAGQVKTFCKIKGGGAVSTLYHTAAIDKNGVVWGWGNITYGRLGINKDISEITPVRICNI